MNHRDRTSNPIGRLRLVRLCVLGSFVAFGLSLSGCVEDDSTRPTEVSATVDAGPIIDTGITYGHVAPIFRQYCNSCHSPGGVAPMAFDSYEATKKWAPAIRVSVSERTMPPWLLTGDGSCGEFKDSAWLSEQDVKTIEDWVIGGAQPAEVDPMDQQPIKLSELGGDNVVELKMPVTYGPQASKPTSTGAFDDYRCFPIQTGLDKDVFVTATEVIPGDPSIVHHVLVFSVNPQAFPVDAPEFGSNEKVMQSLDSTNNDRPGWPCFAAAGQGVLMDSLLVAWAPGEDVNRYPKGTGLKLPKGNILVMQVHYNVLGGVKEDRTRIRLAIEDEVERPAWMALHDPFLFSTFGTKPKSIEAGLPDALVKWSASPFDLNFWVPSEKTASLEIHGIYPHMHKRGQTMKVKLVRKGQEKCVAEVKRWDFDWQRMYYLKEPIRFEKGDYLVTECTFDTQDSDKPVMPGFGTSEEMCLTGLYVTTPSP